MADWPIKFNVAFKISTIFLNLNGSHPFISVRDRFWLLKIMLYRIVAIFCFFLLLNSIISHEIKNKNYTEAIKNSIMAIVAVTVTFKHSILIHRQISIKHLIKTLDEDYKSAENLPEDEKNIIIHYVEKGVQVCRFWLVAAGFTSFMFPVKALIQMGYSCITNECKLFPLFDLTYPKLINDNKDVLYVYLLTNALCFTFDMFAMSVYICFDPIVPIFMLHICGQLDLIGRRLSKVLSAPTTDQKVKELKSINMKLVEIYLFVKNVQNIFVVLYEFNMKTTTFLIPFSAFQIVESIRHKEISFEFISFFLGAILHFFMPCYYSNLLMDKSESLRQSIYSCKWETEPNIQIRKIILLMLTRTSSPLVIKTIFYPICLDTFAEMARQAYGIYNIMNAAWG